VLLPGGGTGVLKPHHLPVELFGNGARKTGPRGNGCLHPNPLSFGSNVKEGCISSVGPGGEIESGIHNVQTREYEISLNALPSEGLHSSFQGSHMHPGDLLPQDLC